MKAPLTPNDTMIHVIRHGETDFNLEGRYQGAFDIPLNETGRRQASEMAAALCRLAPRIIYCSHLKRVTETAEIIARSVDASVTVDARLAERSLGVYEGLTQEQAAALYPDLYARVITREFDGAPPNGETPREVCARVNAALDDILKTLDGRTALIVSHGFVAKAIDAYFNPGKDEAEFFSFSLKNGETFSYRNDTAMKKDPPYADGS